MPQYIRSYTKIVKRGIYYGNSKSNLHLQAVRQDF